MFLALNNKGDKSTMNGKPIHITQFDLERLRELLFDAQSTDYRKSEYLEKLQMEIDRAEVVSPKDIPTDVVTMNSTVCIEDLDTKEEEIYTLVFPEDADLGQGKISILAPIGTAMLGYEVGDSFEWDVPGGKRRLRVKKIIYQPEASGDYHL
jgi:regulator of nucleoside diphosphate kinase